MGEDSFEQLGVKAREEIHKEDEKVLCLVASMETIGLPQMHYKTGHSIAECISSPCMTSCLSSGFCGRNRASQRQGQGPRAPHLWASGACFPFTAANTHAHLLVASAASLKN